MMAKPTPHYASFLLSVLGKGGSLSIIVPRVIMFLQATVRWVEDFGCRHMQRGEINTYPAAGPWRLCCD